MRAATLAELYNAEDRQRAAGEYLDDAGGIAVLGGRCAGEHAVTHAGRRRLFAARWRDGYARRGAVPFRGHGNEFAIGIAAAYLQHHCCRQVSGALEATTRSGHGAFGGKFLQQRLQRNARRACDAEVARDLALAGFARIVRDEGKYLLA